MPGSSGDIVIAQIGHGRISYAGSGAGGESDDAQWIANGGRGGDASSIQRGILDSSIIVNSSYLMGYGMDVIAQAYQGSNHIVRAQVGMGDLNFAESNAGGDGAQAASSVVEQWNQQVNGGRGGDAVAIQAEYLYDITVDVGAAPDTTDADLASLRVLTDAQNIFLGTNNHILASIGSGGYSHADSSAASGGDAGTRSALAGIGVGSSETPFNTYASYRNGARGGNAISEIGVQDQGEWSGNVYIVDRVSESLINDQYLADDLNGSDITVTTHDLVWDLTDVDGGLVRYARYDGIKVESKAGPGDSHSRAVDTNTAQIGHSGFNRADAESGEGISDDLAFGRIAATNADGGDGIQTTYSALIQEGDGGNGGDAFAYTGSVYGDVIVTNVAANEANNAGSAGSVQGVEGIVSFVDTGTNEDTDTNIVIRSTGGTVKGDHRSDARIGHNIASEAVTDSNGGDAADVPHPNISFIAAVSTRGGGAGDASSIQEELIGDITVIAENSIIVESEKTTLAGDEGFYVAIGHRLEADLEATGQGGESGLIGDVASVAQATFKDDGNDDADDATQTDVADEEAYLLATYKALYEIKQRMAGTWDSDSAESFKVAFNSLSAYEQSLVSPILGDPNAIGEGIATLTSEDASDYTNVAAGIRGISEAKLSTSDTGIEHRFASTLDNEGYGSGKDVSDILNEVIFGARDNDAETDGLDNTTATTTVDESTYGNIPTPSADEIETLRFLLASSGDGGSVRSYQNSIAGDITVTAHANDISNTGSDNSLANARGVYVSATDAALSGSDIMAAIGHGIELIKARAGDAGLDDDPSTYTTAAIGGDGGDAIVYQGSSIGNSAALSDDETAAGLVATTGDIAIHSSYVIDVTANNNALGKSEEDTRIGHQLKIGSMLEDFSTGTSTAIVAGHGGEGQRSELGWTQRQWR